MHSLKNIQSNNTSILRYLHQEDYMNKKELDRIIRNSLIKSFYQPIVSLIDGLVIGYEALSRGGDQSSIKSPLELIDLAKKYGRLMDLEYLMRKSAIKHFTDKPDDTLLFINIDPDIIKEPSFRDGMTLEFLTLFNLKPENIVFEITENTAISDYDAFRDILRHYRSQGYSIAIDDVGAGYSGLKMIMETVPKYIKIDMDLIRDIDITPFKKAMIKALVSFGKDTGVKLIAEGIETTAELSVLLELGVDYGQGYVLGRPNLKPIDIYDDAKEFIRSSLIPQFVETDKIV